LEEIAGGEEIQRAGGVEGADCEGYCAGEWIFCEAAEGEGEEVGRGAGVKEEDFTTELAEGRRDHREKSKVRASPAPT